MPDYNLGRAHGEIEITADTRGIQEAKAEMAATAAEAEVLDRSMGRVNEQFDKNRRSSTLTAEQLVRQRGAVEELRKTYERLNQDYQDAAKKREDIDRRLQRAAQDEESSGKRLLSLGRDLERARADEQRTLERMETAYSRYQNRISLLGHEIERFNQAHISATTGLRNMARQAEEAGRSVEFLVDKLSRVSAILGTAGIYGLFGGAAGGSLGLLGGSGLQGLTVGIGGLLEVVKDFSGAMLLIPGVVNGAALSLGTLAVGFHGIAQELGSLEDPAKFVQGLRELAPAAQQAMLTIQQFTYSFRGARQEVQQSLFEPILKDIQPLIQTWLPQLMNAGKQIANEFGQAFHQVFQFFQEPEVIKGFQTFVGNLVQGFQAARQAIQPFLQAWNTLANVGSGVFERLGKAIATIANEFNSWVQQASRSGELLRVINAALDGFTQLGHILRDIGIGIFNFFDAGARTGTTFLQTIAQMAAEFRAWTESVKGQNTLASFFSLLKQSADAARPIIHDLGQGIAIIAGTLDRLGLAIQPGLVSFFDSLVKALGELKPVIIGMAPAINQFLQAFGQTLVEVVKQMGPQLPTFFKNLSDALVELMKVLPRVAGVLAELMKHITPEQVIVVISLVAAFKAFTAVMGALDAVLDANPIVLIAVALVALGVAIYEAYQHWQPFHDAVQTVWDALKGFMDWLGTVPGAISSALKPLGDLADTVGDWGENIIHSFADGISKGIHWVSDAVGNVLQPLDDLLHGRSPTKEGPLSEDGGSEGWGARLSENYAAGISSGSSAVGDAATGVAGSAAGGLAGGAGTGAGGGGTGGGSGSFTTAGVTGISGKGTVGGSGFDQWINFITTDMKAWSNIAQHAFGLFTDISQVVVKGITAAANLWNYGRNPLTQAGGIAGPPALPNQNPIPGASYAPIYGPAPGGDWGKNLPGAPGAGQGGTGQADVPGVRKVGPQGRVYGPPGPGGAAPPAPAAPAAPAQAGPAAAPSAAQPGDSPLVSALRGKGYSDDKIRTVLGFSKTEGLNPAGNPTLGWMDSQLGGATDLQSHVDALDKQFKDRESQTINGHVIGPFPEHGTDSDRANWIADVVGQNSSPTGPDNQAQPPRAQYVQNVISAMPPAAPPPAGGAPGGAPAGAVLGQQRPGVQQGAEGLMPAAKNISGIIQSLFPQIQTIGGVRPNALPYHPSGHALDIMIPGDYDSPEGIATGNQMLDFLRQNAQSLGIYDLIYRDQYYATGQQPTPYQASAQTPDERHLTHIHVTTQGWPGQEGAPGEPQFQPDISKLVDLPPSFKRPPPPPLASQATTSQGDANSRSADPSHPGAGAAAALGGGAIALGAIAARTNRAVRRANATLIDQRGMQALLSEGADPADIQMLQDLIDEGGPGAQDALSLARQLIADSGGAGGATGRGSLRSLFPNLDIIGSGGPGGAGPTTAGQSLYGGGIDIARIQAARGQLGRAGAAGRTPGERLGYWGQGEPPIQAAPAPAGPQPLSDSSIAQRTASLRSLIAQGRLSPSDAAAIDPNLAIDVYHATGDAGAQGILGEGFNALGGRQNYFSTSLQNARTNQPFYGERIIAGRVPVSAFDPNFISGGVRATNEALQGQQFRELTPEEIAGGVPPRNPPASVVGDAGRGLGSRVLGTAGRGLGAAADIAAIPLMINQAGQAVSQLPRPLQGPGALAGVGIVGGTAAAIGGVPAAIGAGVLGAVSTATGAATGQEPAIDYNRYPVTGRPPVPTRDPTGGLLSGPLGIGGQKPVPVDITHQGGVPVGPPLPPGVQVPGRPSGAPPGVQVPQGSRDATLGPAGAGPPRGPVQGPPAFPGQAVPGQPPVPVKEAEPDKFPGGKGAPQPQGPAPQRPAGQAPPAAQPQGEAAQVGGQPPQPGAGPGAQAQPAAAQQAQGPTGPGGVGPGSTDSPLTQFNTASASLGKVVNDVFTVVNDVIENIKAAAQIGDTLVRGVHDTEDIIHIIQGVQTFIKTGADIANTVSDTASGIASLIPGDPSGGGQSAQAALQAVSAIAGIVSGALTATNEAISLGIEIYHEVGKYAGFIFGGILGGSLGTLGGNVHMLLNTRTGQIQAYSEDNPLNKNIIDSPFGNAYNRPPPAQNQMTQLNMYSGPGTPPMQMFQDSMWIISTGAPQVASVAPGAQ